MIEHSQAALWTFAVYTVAVFVLAILSNRVARGKSFAGEYFLGSRGFGTWTFALTFAATSASGGSFTGYPALIYEHGWTVGLWIAGYMVVPLVAMALIGKRINQVARQCDALTIPEVLRGRFESSLVNVVATSLLVFFMFFYLVAQFKAGGKILSTLLSGDPTFRVLASFVARSVDHLPWVNQAGGDYLLSLLVFAAAVIVYVVYGGFRAVVWTDVMQGIVMFFGVVVMLGLALWQVGGLAQATKQMARMTPPMHGRAVVSDGEISSLRREIPKGTWVAQDADVFRLAERAIIEPGERFSGELAILKITTPGELATLAERIEMQHIPAAPLTIQVIELTPYAYGHGKEGVYVTNPGPSRTNSFGFLALGTAISFFIFWPFAAAGLPSNMVRLMSFRDTPALRYSIVTVTFYFFVIYFALLLVFCCARVLMPGMEIDPDRTMPEFANQLSLTAGAPWLAGLLVAAPFAAVMSSVDSFLLVVSSAVVRDIYQGHIRPDASDQTVRRLSYVVTSLVGVLAVIVALNPPTYLQDLIVFATGGMAACFLLPMVLALYWPAMTGAAAVAGMLGGTITHLVLTVWGYAEYGQFQPYELMGLNPFLWDLIGSAVALSIVAKLGPPANVDLANRFFA
jgi:Na+/proline symporter